MKKISLFCLAQKKKLTSPFITYAHLIPRTYRLGFTNLDTEISLDSLPVKGSVPKWISGTLFRNGPAKFMQGSSWISNWLMGLL